MTGFLNLDEDGGGTRIGDQLRGRPGKAKVDRAKFDGVAAISERHGFGRGTRDGTGTAVAPRRMGRPPLNQDMGYWRIYVSPELRGRLTETSSREGRRLNDLLEDALAAYEAGGGP